MYQDRMDLKSTNGINQNLPGVILIVIDGCTADGLQKAATPNIDGIVNNGSYTFRAQTIFPTITLPCLTSMLSGAVPAWHGIYANIWFYAERECKSIIDLAHMCGRKAAAFYDWEWLRELASPGALEFSYFRRVAIEPKASMDIANVCATYIMDDNPDFCFIFLGSVDTVGHSNGWMSTEYLKQIEIIDQAVGRIIEGVRKVNQMDRYYFIILADHGGHEKIHGTERAEDMTIPWIVSGPGVKKHYEIIEDVYIYDTAPTIFSLLRLPVQQKWRGGKVIGEIFDRNA
ncbi:MAG: alkaline phosphatase family protein [Thermodesulfobacteriota bacterium]